LHPGIVRQRFWLVSLSAALEVRDHQWIQAADEIVHAKLQAELLRLRAAATSMEALGCTEVSQVRSTFLSATKLFHPNRFARRPEVIRTLANEVFLELKKSYDRAKGDAASLALEETRTKIANEKQERLERRRNASSKPPINLADRQEQKDRRRNQVRDRLGGTGSGTQRIAQVRAATDRNNSDSGSADLQEAEFEKALKIMQSGNFAAAATAFKAVAVSRPSEKRYRLHMHYAQGRMLQSTGKVDEARSEYKRCLGLDASFVLAHESMASLPKEGKKKGSFMSKLFGK
tara:strand:- start:13068 stop:13934 length:867 start_codon:yes stop_codon:yes gene_type:complete